MCNKDIQTAFLNGEYSLTLNKVHPTDSRIIVHEVIAPEENKEVYDFVIRAISTYGATDVEEVKHAHWIPKKLGDCECSNCHEEYGVCGGLLGDYNYCPGCGAKMDEKEYITWKSV